MKHFIYAITAILALSSAAQAEVIGAELNGLVCAFCAKGIEKNFMKNDAVESVHVDLEKKCSTITTKEGATLSDETITKIVTDAGYNLVKINRGKAC